MPALTSSHKSSMSTCDKCHSPLSHPPPPPIYHPATDPLSTTSTLEIQPSPSPKDQEADNTKPTPPPSNPCAALLFLLLLGGGIWAWIRFGRHAEEVEKLERQLQQARLGQQTFADPAVAVTVTVTEWYEALSTRAG